MSGKLTAAVRHPTGGKAKRTVAGDSTLSLRRAVLLALAAGLSVAAVVGIAAILTGSFDRTDVRLVGTSLGFSVFAALGAAGARAERTKGRRYVLGRGTIAAAALSYALLVVGIWIDHGAGVWRGFGVLAVVALAASHASLVICAARASDSPAIRRLTTVSVIAGCLDAGLGAIAIAGVTQHVDPIFVRAVAVLVIVMPVSTALPRSCGNFDERYQRRS